MTPCSFWETGKNKSMNSSLVPEDRFSHRLAMIVKKFRKNLNMHMTTVYNYLALLSVELTSLTHSVVTLQTNVTASTLT